MKSQVPSQITPQSTLHVSTGTRLVELDGIRAVAVVLVFLVHFYALIAIRLPKGAIHDFFAMAGLVGNLGVDLFFALSGYLIYGNLMARQTKFLDFMARRIQRIYPVFLAVAAIYLAASFAMPWRSKLPSEAAAIAVFLFQNLSLVPLAFGAPALITVTWSLGYEMTFYLLLPLFIAVCGLHGWSRNGRCIWFVLWGLGLPMLGLEGQAGVFFFGMIAREISSSRTEEQPILIGSFVVIAAVFCACWFYVNNATGGRAWHGPLPFVVRPTVMHAALVGTACLLLIVYAVHVNGVFKRFLGSTFCVGLGGISYSFFLMHSLVLQGIQIMLSRAEFPYTQNTIWFALLLGFSVSLLGTAILFIAVEKRFSIKPIPASENR